MIYFEDDIETYTTPELDCKCINDAVRAIEDMEDFEDLILIIEKQ